MPVMPSARPTSLRRDSGSCSRTKRRCSRPDRHRVGEDRAASGRQLLHAEEDEPVPAGDVEEREHRDLAPPARAGRASQSPDKCATASRPSAANGSVIARNVSGASSVTPIFSTASCSPRPASARRRDSAARSVDRRVRRRCAHVIGWRRGAGAEIAQRLVRSRPCRRLRRTCSGAARAPASPTRRAGCGPGNSGSLRVELVDVALASSARSGDTSSTPSWCSIRSSTGPTPTISLRSSGAPGAEQRRTARCSRGR